MDALVNILCGLAVIAVAGCAVWLVMSARSHREDEQKDANRQGGGGGPTPTR